MFQNYIRFNLFLKWIHSLSREYIKLFLYLKETIAMMLAKYLNGRIKVSKTANDLSAVYIQAFLEGI